MAFREQLRFYIKVDIDRESMRVTAAIAAGVVTVTTLKEK